MQRLRQMRKVLQMPRAGTKPADDEQAAKKQAEWKDGRVRFPGKKSKSI